MIPALITGGSQVLGTAIDAVSSAIQNKRMRQYNDQQYAKQRQDALTDWNRQNEYNSPASQMARLREAGLNPNLVYGTGAATSPAQAIRSTETKQWQPRPLTIGQGMGEAVGSYFDTRIKQAQYDNLKAQNTVLLNKAVLQGLEQAQVAGRTAFTESQRVNANRLADASIEATSTNVLKLKNDIQMSQNESSRRDARLEMDSAKIVADIARQKAETSLVGPRKQEMLARISNLESNTEYRNMMNEFEGKLAKAGMTKNDELWQRMLAQVADGVTGGLSISDIISMIKEKILNFKLF